MCSVFSFTFTFFSFLNFIQCIDPFMDIQKEKTLCGDIGLQLYCMARDTKGIKYQMLLLLKVE